MTRSQTFPPEPSSVGDARRYVADGLTGVSTEQLEVIVLAVSELAANSVRHAGTPFTVTVDQDDHEVRVTVNDAGTGRPAIQNPGPMTPSGRGLLIVERISDEWGSSSDAGHNRVWFSVVTDRPSEAVPAQGAQRVPGVAGPGDRVRRPDRQAGARPPSFRPPGEAGVERNRLDLVLTP